MPTPRADEEHLPPAGSPTASDPVTVSSRRASTAGPGTRRTPASTGGPLARRCVPFSSRSAPARADPVPLSLSRRRSCSATLFAASSSSACSSGSSTSASEVRLPLLALVGLERRLELTVFPSPARSRGGLPRQVLRQGVRGLPPRGAEPHPLRAVEARVLHFRSRPAPSSPRPKRAGVDAIGSRLFIESFCSPRSTPFSFSLLSRAHTMKDSSASAPAGRAMYATLVACVLGIVLYCSLCVYVPSPFLPSCRVRADAQSPRRRALPSYNFSSFELPAWTSRISSDPGMLCASRVPLPLHVRTTTCSKRRPCLTAPTRSPHLFLLEQLTRPPRLDILRRLADPARRVRPARPAPVAGSCRFRLPHAEGAAEGGARRARARRRPRRERCVLALTLSWRAPSLTHYLAQSRSATVPTLGPGTATSTAPCRTRRSGTSSSSRTLSRRFRRPTSSSSSAQRRRPTRASSSGAGRP